MEQTDTARTGTFRIDEPRLSVRLASMARAYALEQLDSVHVLPMKPTVLAFLKGAQAALQIVLDSAVEDSYRTATAEGGEPTGKETDKTTH